MKKFLIAAITAILLLFLFDMAYYRWGVYIDLNKDQEVSFFATTQGKEILADTGKGMEPFEIRGVDMGVGIPGYFSTEFAIDKETYLRWFGMIQEMGANTIRVYTIQIPDFYEAVYEYNKDNPNPLYILHGVWVNDYVQNSHVDAYDDSFREALLEDCRTLVDVIHGRRKINLGYQATSASGVYNKDISDWVLGYILGVEWEDVTVAYTNHMKPENNSYHGDYMYTSEEATPFEAMLAEVGDKIIRYESEKYKEQRLIAFSNWPTTDPLDYPEEVKKLFMKCASVDVEHILSTDRFKSGQFASYHVYSYYPDYLAHYDSWKNEIPFAEEYRLEDGDYNTYGIYLELLCRHHKMPVVISEFGVPTSRGRAQLDLFTARSQGYMSEQEQGTAIVESYKDIRRAGCAGCVIFSWQDEWFKRTWNTMANVDLSKTAYWSDFQTNEQFFGLMAFDPGKETSVCYTDGDVDEWSEKELIADYGSSQLYMKYDEKFIYFRIHQEHPNPKEILYIPVDVTPKTGSYYAKEEELKFDRQADFLIVLDGEDNSKVLVQERYEAFRVIFAEDYGEENPYFNVPDKDSPLFVNIYMALQLGKINAVQEEDKMAERFETGRLTFGNGNPYSEDYNSVSDFIVKGNEIEIRLPWQLLNFSNPAEQQVHDDYYENYGIENLKIDSIYAGLGSSEDKGTRIRMGEMPLVGWGKNPEYHERLKQSYYAVKEIWAKNAG